VEDGAERPVAELDDVGVATHRARLVAGVELRRVELSGIAPRLAAVLGDADDDAAVLGVLVALGAQDRP